MVPANTLIYRVYIDQSLAPRYWDFRKIEEAETLFTDSFLAIRGPTLAGPRLADLLPAFMRAEERRPLSFHKVADRVEQLHWLYAKFQPSHEDTAMPAVEVASVSFKNDSIAVELRDDAPDPRRAVLEIAENKPTVLIP